MSSEFSHITITTWKKTCVSITFRSHNYAQVEKKKNTIVISYSLYIYDL